MRSIRKFIRNWAEALPLILLRAILLRLPWNVVTRLGAELGRAAFDLLRFRRATTLQQLSIALGDTLPPEERVRVSRACYRFFGAMAFQMLAMPGLGERRIRERAALHDLSRLLEALRGGNGAIIVTGHLGNWELIAGALHAAGIPISGYAGRQHNPIVDGLINRARRAVGHDAIGKGPGAKAIFKALRANRTMAFVADQHDSEKRYYVSFFGRPVSAAPGPAVIARRMRAPIFFVRCTLDPDGRYGFRLESLPAKVTENEEWDVLSMMQAFFDALEAAVRSQPEQYFWMHRRFRPIPPSVTLSPGNRAFLAQRLPASALPPA